MITLHKKQELDEALGLDLSAEAIKNIKLARQDRETGNTNAYVDLDDI